LIAGAAAALAGCAGVPRPEPIESLRVWDMHVHIMGVPGKTPEERAAFLVTVAERMGIERLCMHLGMEPLVQDPTPEDLRRCNDECLRAVAAARGRALGLVYLNPNHREASLDEFERCVVEGPMVGVKLWTARRASAPELDPIVRRAAEYGAPIYQHTWLKVGGNFPGESTPMDLAELARRHPDAALICGHAGGDWERGIRAVRAAPNLMLETAGFDPTAGVVEMAVRELGAERIVYGSDVGGRSFASQLAKIVGAAIPEASKRLILGGNLRRLLGPIMAKKGIA
jgi:predicted TIM-barrel fold metal-dependent hydrolase